MRAEGCPIGVQISVIRFNFPPSLSYTVENLISQVGLRGNAAIIDVARETGTTETLSEMKIMCSSEEKVRLFLP